MRISEVLGSAKLPIEISMLLKLLAADKTVYLMRRSRTVENDGWATSRIVSLEPLDENQGRLTYMVAVHAVGRPSPVVKSMQFTIPFKLEDDTSKWQLFKRGDNWMLALSGIEQDGIPDPAPLAT